MPIISSFFGVLVRMFYNDHNPPHFHAEYQGQHGKFRFDGEIIVSHIASRVANRLIREWAIQHAADLEMNWRRMKAGVALERIEPLE
jgi:hypothetical protein